MRKLLAIFLVLLGCLTFVGQAVAGAAASYSDCCLQGCKGMAHCASATCQACAAPQPAPLAGQPPPPALQEPAWPVMDARFDAGLRQRPWTPPD